MNALNEKWQKIYNHARYEPDRQAGHYESYFQRFNHPERPLAFWNRYTIFSPTGNPREAICELWAVYFDGEKGVNYAAKTELPADRAIFDRDRFSVKIQESFLKNGALRGTAGKDSKEISWDLTYQGGQAPLFNFPLKFYEGGFPKAKVLVGSPNAKFNGQVRAGGETIQIENWVGSQNHNWGSRHTDSYAWGQVCGFANSPDTFLELATAQIKLGPLWTPRITPVVLRHQGREYRLNDLHKSLGRADFRYFHWNFKARSQEIKLRGEISARREAFVCLPYYNPPGGVKLCLNSKLAGCRLWLKRPGRPEELLESPHGAAFEILTDDTDGHGLIPAV